MNPSKTPRLQIKDAPVEEMIMLRHKIPVIFLCLTFFSAIVPAQENKPVYVGFDGEFSLLNSTSAQSIERGIRIALDEINEAGGELNGRPMKLLTRDNRSVPARGRDNIRRFAKVEDLVAVVGGVSVRSSSTKSIWSTNWGSYYWMPGVQLMALPSMNTDRAIPFASLFATGTPCRPCYGMHKKKGPNRSGSWCRIPVGGEAMPRQPSVIKNVSQRRKS
ncbi:MAG: hypothetical protein DIZ77_09200 [endosymbiont of Seepiophila jonesi]|uniref:Leucine-binding protein domain-containing protein n=1 Tax=endosymbiont of Lamellibrachia luymesi TaxID=2200907 RepID=A0A370DBS2_9GAMM|nr:MAG: hypothetical protein DIZ79_18090 [endosymbiont of Lamellibrachia luymesi]RDH92093.1 MAG: hypothetical protein DIZ77_09200 [endosymbiont of Seepiophila jonesi]